ncbi:histidine ABC transporter permease HisM [Paralcaligenes sp. KSB-10]|uniref:histidine ABC transporter permease HisM n=1 Tax=Paralcaligenes sp. KSB-10 TaxID=2901142 RepID=UPI001E5D10FF|nr:histidine ABC transporter permease HisM [Paralcaligenes sp. KSB-10]UHL65433.1 histidine ABC transporter permease HisM [Paralcaligenes sp. KSB-10]
MIDILKEYWPQYLGIGNGWNISGAAMTLWILVLTMLIAFLASIPLAILRASSNKRLSRPVQLYTFVIRGTPLYVQLLIVYTGFFSLEFIRHTPSLSEFFRSGFNCVIVAFSFNCCAYLTEVLAGSIRSIPAGEIEAARAFGFSRVKIYTRLILPSALKRALPYYGNEVIILLHCTSIAFTATVPELLKVARDVNSATYAAFSSFSIAGIFYAVIAVALVAAFRLMEKRWLAFLKPLPTH